ncbi:MAG: hypothetical protein NVS1B4_15050 [Gemmatimonadaceae bacterium]
MRVPFRNTVRRRRVLIADASSATLLWARLLLKEANVDVLVARDGEAAIASALVDHPDLILIEVHLPGMSGLEACRFMRGTPTTRGIPIVMIITREEERGACFESGGNDVITKPFDRVLFRSTVRRWLEHANARRLNVTTVVGPLIRSDRTLRPVLRVIRSRSARGKLRGGLLRGVR